MNIELNTIRCFHPISGKRGYYIWLACHDCGKQRWVNYYSLQRSNYHGRCKSCDGKYHYNLFTATYTGHFLTTEGYVMIQLKPDSFYYSMTESNGYIKEHRLVMAQYLGRCLMPFEIVHHINGQRDDNRLGNLKLGTPNDHAVHHNRIRAYRDKKTMKILNHLY